MLSGNRESHDPRRQAGSWKQTTMQHILCFGHDEMLLKTRRWILERQFCVEVVSDLAALASLVERYRFHLVIFCQTLSLQECQRACDLLQARSPATMILSLDMLAEDGPRSMFGRSFNPLEGSKAFSDCVVAMLEPTAAASDQLSAG